MLPERAARIVSLNPSLTATLVAVGATDAIVGIDAYSPRQIAEVSDRPQVGGLYDPSLEAMVALRPDLVVLVPSAEQRELRARLVALDVPVLSLDPRRYDDVATMLVALGRCAGRAEAAERRAAELRAALQRARAASTGRARPRSVLILQRDPLFVASSGSFLDEMLEAAGAENVARALPGPYPRASMEWLVAARPELILDASGEPEPADRFWSRWPSLPAVASGRVRTLDPALVTVPGPQLDAALARLVEAIAPAARQP